MITLLTSTNIFARPARTCAPYSPACTLGDYLDPEMRKLAYAHPEALHLARNGEPAGPRTKLLPGDTIAAIIIPAGPLALGKILVGVILSTAVGYAANLLMGAPDTPDMESSSPTYSFAGIANRVGQGHTIPVGYGHHLVGGDVISNFRKESKDGSDRNELWLLYSLGWGEFEEIGGMTQDTEWIDAGDTSGITIDGNDASSFHSMQFACRMGTSGQGAIDGFDDVTTVSQNVGAEIRHSVDDVRQKYTYTTNQAIDKFELIFNFNSGVWKRGNSGQKLMMDVYFRVRWKVTGSDTGYGEWKDVTIPPQFRDHGFTRRWRSYKLDENAVYDIQVQRMTIDDDAQTGGRTYVSTGTLDSINLMTLSGEAYPDTALLGMRVIAHAQLSNPNPTVLVECKQRKVPIWDGVSEKYPTFTDTYTRNPAWCLYDLLTNVDFALGNVFDAGNIRLSEWEEFADYCDEQVDDGDSGTHPRHRLDIRIDRRRRAWDWIREIAGNARCTLVPEGDQIGAKTHEAANPIQVVGLGALKNLKVQYAGTRDKFNKIILEYRDEDANWAKRQAEVTASPVPPDDELIERNEELRGITRRAEALRNGNHRMLQNLRQTSIFEFDVGPEVLAAEAGDVISLSSSIIGSLSGRTQTGATSGTIKIDRDAYLEPGETYKVTLQHADDTTEEKTISTGSGFYEAGTALSITGTWTSTPAEGINYILFSATDGRFDVVIAELTLNEDLSRHVRAIQYDADVYDDIVSTVTPAPTPPDKPDPDKIPADVDDLDVQALVTTGQHQTQLHLQVTWTHDEDSWADSTRIWTRLQQTLPFAGPTQDENWIMIGDVEDTSLTWLATEFFEEGDTVEVAACPVSQAGASKHPSKVTAQTATFQTVPEIFVNHEAMNGTVDGTNDAFTVDFPRRSGSERLFVDGLLRRNTSADANHQGMQTFIDTPPEDNTPLCSYIYDGFTQSQKGIIEYEELGTGDGSDTTWNTNKKFIEGSVWVWLDGILQDTTSITEDGENKLLTFDSPPPDGSLIVARYLKKQASGLRQDIHDATTIDTFTADGATKQWTATVTPKAAAFELYLDGLATPGTLSGSDDVSIPTEPPDGTAIALISRDDF